MHIFSKYVVPVAATKSLLSTPEDPACSKHLCLPPRSFNNVTDKQSFPLFLQTSRHFVIIPISSFTDIWSFLPTSYEKSTTFSYEVTKPSARQFSGFPFDPPDTSDENWSSRSSRSYSSNVLP